MLTVKDLSYEFESVKVLDNINLYIKPLETVAILGPSGVGKTTLFNLISGIYPVQFGTITLDGTTDLQGRVSYMLQKDMLYQHYTVIENIMLPLLINGESKQAARKNAQNLLAQFEMEQWQDYYPHALSGGMRQRIALLRTAAFGRSWILLDEAFSALDAITRQNLQQWFVHYRKEMKWSTLLITHDIDEALLLADRIYILKGRPGKIFKEIEGINKDDNLQELVFHEDFLKAKRVILDTLN